MRPDEGRDVSEVRGPGTCHAPIGFGCNRSAEAALVEGVDEDAIVGEGFEEGVVAVTVVAEAVQEDDDGNERARRLSLLVWIGHRMGLG